MEEAKKKLIEAIKILAGIAGEVPEGGGMR